MTAEGATPEQVDELLQALVSGQTATYVLSAADHALLEYADKLTRTPATIRAADVEAVRRAGFDDRAIHDACAIVAYYAFVNRIADGLGVELEG